MVSEQAGERSALATSRKGTKKGIKDFAYKKTALIALDDTKYFSFGDVVFAVLPQEDQCDRAMLIIQAAEQWHKSVPGRKHRRFFTELRDWLRLPESVTGLMLITCPIEQFIDYLPENRRGAAATLVAREIQKKEGRLPNWHNGREVTSETAADRAIGVVSSNGAARTSVAIHFPIAATPPLVMDGVRSGRIDQKVYYLTPDAAQLWQAIVLSDGYPTYDQCKLALKRLTESAAWKAQTFASTLEGAVMLGGGGAPTKDVILIRALLSAPSLAKKTVHYVLVDVSKDMMLQSHEYIRTQLSALGVFHRVEPKLYGADILAMDHIRNELRPRGSYIWAITGGTLGNLSESAFFESINRHALLGDLLIVSADTFEEPDKENFKKALEQKYDNPSVFELLGNPLASMWSRISSNLSFSEALSSAKVRVVDGRGPQCDIDRSLSLEISLVDPAIILLTSTRYQRRELIQFASGYGWKHLHTEDSPLNKNFGQFFFIRV